MSAGSVRARDEGGRQGCQGQEVEAVVVQDPGEPRRCPEAQPVEPGPRGLGPGQVALAPEPQEPALGGAQTAVRPDSGEGAADGVEQIQVGQSVEPRVQACQSKPGGQQRQVEGLAVVAHQQIAASEGLDQGR